MEESVEILDSSAHAMFEILFKNHYRKIYKIVYFYIKDQYIAEEAVQQAFMIAFKKIDTLADKEKFSSWVTVIAINEAKGFYRKQANVIPFEELAITDASSDKDFLDVELNLDMDDIFSKLKPQDAQVLALKYYADLSLGEISSIMNISIPNVKVRLHRAKSRFRQKYNDAFDYLQGGGNNDFI
ncbi:MAG: RNA polymerase sigma factor [Desulfitobacterium sp.]